MRSILFAGGGSGGHLSPGLALAEALGSRAEATFACSERPIDAHMLGHARVDHIPLPAIPPSPRPLRAARFVRGWMSSKKRCRSLIESKDVGAVVALGGFVSAPAVAAARSASVPTVLLNLDARPGRANQWVARRCAEVWTAVPATGSVGTAPVVGMPIRRHAVAPGDPARCRRELGLDTDRPTLLITGASQGARSINRFMELFSTRHAAALDGWQVLHLCGRDTAPADLEREYEKGQVPAVVLPFLDAMGTAWGAADLALTRAGASSVAEVHANAVPALFLPYPYHDDDHQRWNAAPLVDRGAARLTTDHVDVEANLADAGAILSDLLTSASARSEMRDRLRETADPLAAERIADRLVALL